MGTISEWAGDFRAIAGLVTRRAATIAEILRDNGYGTIAVGKWPLTPMKEVSAAGAFWRLGRWGAAWYGFHGAFTDQWNPKLYRDNHPIERPAGEDYTSQRRPGDPGRAATSTITRSPRPSHPSSSTLPRRLPLAAPRAASARRQVQRPLRCRLGRSERLADAPQSKLHELSQHPAWMN